MVELMRSRLREDVTLRISYADETPFGSGVSGLAERFLKQVCRSLESVVMESGLAGLEAQAERWIPKLMAPGALGGLYEAPDRLKETCAFPKASLVRPAALRACVPRRDGVVTRDVALGPTDARSLAGWIGEWHMGARRPRNGRAAAVWDLLQELGAFEPPKAPVQPLRDGVTFVGHATVAVAYAGTQVVFDPFLLPPTLADPQGPRPHTASDVRPDAVFITHGHPDHYDLSTLLRWGCDVPIYVPSVPRESLLSTDMAYRLRELGFNAVHCVEWFDEVTVGPLRIAALPFYGEQPTDVDMLRPQARNRGNTYFVRGPGISVGLLADAGTDELGSTAAMAEAARDKFGAPDVLFGGYRGWRVQPIRYLFSSVARYLLFVPPDRRIRWHQIMNDAEDLIATANAWGARTIVPYANGGAPWFSRIGLGPRGDQADDPRVDPPPEAVDEAHGRSGRLGSKVIHLHAGDHVAAENQGAVR